MDPLIQLKKPTSSFVIALLVAFRLVPLAHAVVPPPDGGYAGFNTAEGTNALKNLSTGVANAAVGWYSLFSNTDGSYNTAVGAGTLLFNVGDQSMGLGLSNTAVGAAALLNNSEGARNTAVGAAALSNNTTGGSNTAVGQSALLQNTTGFDNTAVGIGALFSNDDGGSNTAVGTSALRSNTTGNYSTAVGREALRNNTTGEGNTALGNGALFAIQDGSSNTAVGRAALSSNSTGSGHTAVGYRALETSTATGQFCFANTAVGSLALVDNNDGCSNTAIGGLALGSSTSGSGNVAVGLLAGNAVTTADNVICIGTNVQGGNMSNSCYIGEIFGRTSSGGTAVFINADGKLGTSTSSKRFKEDIKPMDQASDALFSLKPVSFHYKKEIDPASTSQFGLVAEDVEKVSPDLVVRDKEGNPYSVRYDQVNAMLLNEFLRDHATVQELKKEIAALTAIVKEQGAQMQRVSAQLEMNKAPRVVENTY